MSVSASLVLPRLEESLSYSVLHLIEHGLDCARQGFFVEATSFFTQARTRLSGQENPLASALNAFLRNRELYVQAQQTLHEASKRFAQADQQQQHQLHALTALVANLTSSENQRDPSTLYSIITVTTSVTAAGSNQEKEPVLPALHIRCFGSFAVKRLGQNVGLCQNRSGQALLRYLVAKTGHRETMDVLMELLWPNDTPDVARHKLIVATSALRRTLNNGFADQPGGGYVLCKNEVYQLNPAVKLSLDTDEFLALYQAGSEADTPEAMATNYEAACQLYSGPFMHEDLYVDWSFIQREQLERVYLAMAAKLAEHYFENKRYDEAAKWANSLLQQNRCDETAHLQLVRIYLATNHRSEALNQYQRCKTALAEELGLEPQPQIQALIAKI